MKILWLLFSNITHEPWLEGLKTLDHEVDVVFYDRLPVPTDRFILDAVHRAAPDVILYTGKAGGPGGQDIPSVSTLRVARRDAPVIHLSGDFADEPWWPFIQAYRDGGAADLFVNFDGNPNWPKGERDLTLLSPTAPHLFTPRPWSEREIAFGFAGTFTSPSRWDILGHLNRNCGLVLRPWSPAPGRYKEFANWLGHVKVTINVPFSGSDGTTQVKGRILEGALAGCCVMEREGSASEHWFNAGWDYPRYTSKEDAVEVYRQLAANPEKAQAFAEHLQAKVLRNHSPEVFWGRVFDALNK